jgi:hypothetical protein
MHRRATAIRDFYLHRTYTVVPGLMGQKRPRFRLAYSMAISTR